MTTKTMKMIDGNEAVASVAFRTNEVIAIYPITPSSGMGEFSDAWASVGKKNIWGSVPKVVEMQSEGGAAGAVHGALQTGSLTTTFTASQGLLLMIPNMYKIAGELTPTVFHVSARTIAAHALSIFGDHSDVMSTRATGFALLSSASVQEAMDLAAIAQAATLESRIPFLHFFDGFRTSHEVAKVELLPDEVLQKLIDTQFILAHRSRGLSPDHPVLRGSAQNPDVFFQARETANPFYTACPEITQKVMDRFARLTGRSYKLYEYHGAPDAEHVIVMMGSGAEAAHETVDYLVSKGQKVGLLKVRLYRPFDAKRFIEAFPSTTKSIAVLDRTKEPGATGDPLYLDCVTSLSEGHDNGWGQMKSLPKIVGGRYGLSSKDFTPAMVQGVYNNLNQDKPKNHFTVGIRDDVTYTSIDYDPNFSVEPDNVFRGLFYGLGADGTVGANKNSIKIIGENTPNYAQAYFVYDSKKSGAMTTSHLRFGPKPIKSTYLINRANFVACHQPVFLRSYNMLKSIVEGGTFLLNAPYNKEEVWEQLPRSIQETIIKKKLKFYTIDAYTVAHESGLGGRINTIMQVCFFAISNILPKEEAMAAIKTSIQKTYASKGNEVVKQNLAAVDKTFEHLFQVTIPEKASSEFDIVTRASEEAPTFVQDVLCKIIAGDGEDLPVSAFPVDGTFPTATTQWEKRNLAQELPVWKDDLCIQCGKCVIVCPHAAIRVKAYEADLLKDAPSTFKSTETRIPDFKGLKYTIQVAPEDCTGCTICVDICPARNKTEPEIKALNMYPQPPLLEAEKKNWDFFLKIPEMDRRNIKSDKIRSQQMQQPLFEFSSACSGCGETPYLKLVSQLFGDRSIIANATGCSSIYGGNLPTTPWSKNNDGRGPAWANSLFEDNAEFGLGFRLSIDKQKEFASELLKKLSGQLGDELVTSVITASQKNEADIYEQRERVQIVKNKLATANTPEAKQLLSVIDMMVKKSVWIVGGDGWAYDIGYGGLDHVLASGYNVNVLVLDTEVYSNTGGQMSKATPKMATAKFAANGKPSAKKDLGLIAMSYGNIYVASVALGAKDEHTLKALLEAEAYDGPSLVIAYSTCIAHGIDMGTSMQNQKRVVDSGQWLLYRYNPDRALNGENPLILDSRAPKIPVKDFLMAENRFKILIKSNPQLAEQMLKESQDDVDARWRNYEYMAAQKN